MSTTFVELVEHDEVFCEQTSEPTQEPTQEPIQEPSQEPLPEPLDESYLQEKIMVREPAKKCCKIVKKDVNIICRSALNCWSCSLNGLEGCCLGLSSICLAISRLAVGCNRCLEQLDCDGH